LKVKEVKEIVWHIEDGIPIALEFLDASERLVVCKVYKAESGRIVVRQTWLGHEWKMGDTTTHIKTMYYDSVEDFMKFYGSLKLDRYKRTSVIAKHA